MGQGRQFPAGWYRFAEKSLLRLRDPNQLLQRRPALHGEILVEEDAAVGRDELEPGRVLHAVAVGDGSVLVDGDRVREWVRQCAQEAWQRLGRGLDTALVDRDERREPTALRRSLVAIERLELRAEVGHLGLHVSKKRTRCAPEPRPRR